MKEIPKLPFLPLMLLSAVGCAATTESRVLLSGLQQTVPVEFLPPRVIGLVEEANVNWRKFYVVNGVRYLEKEEDVRKWMFLEGHPTGAVVIVGQGPFDASNFVDWSKYTEWEVVGITAFNAPCVFFTAVDPPKAYNPREHDFCFFYPSSGSLPFHRGDKRRVLVKRIMAFGED